MEITILLAILLWLSLGLNVLFVEFWMDDDNSVPWDSWIVVLTVILWPLILFFRCIIWLRNGRISNPFNRN